MMKPVSFFWYLYGAVAVALALTISTLFLAIDTIESQDDWEDFARDAQQLLLMARVECGTEDFRNHCVTELIADHGFEISQHSNSDNDHDEFVDSWSHLNEDIQVFRLAAGFQAQVTNQPNLWLRDSPAHLAEAARDNSPYIVFATAMGITSLLLISIALFLYWPIKRLIRWLKQLEHSADSLAREDYSVHLPALHVSPFFQLTERFNRMIGVVRNNLEEKRLLANAMAHELRTPLSRARLALGLLQRQPDDAFRQTLLSDLDRYLDELEKVTDNSLQLVRLQNSEPNLSELSLDNWIKQKVFSRQGQTSHIDWQMTLMPCSVAVDERFFTLIIDNILSNAERYCQQCIRITITTREKYAELIVADDGPGIADELIEQALQPYRRLDDSRDRRSGGIGLGLALVNSGCARLNIGLSLRNQQPGLSVRLRIPLVTDDVGRSGRNTNSSECHF
ncbi:MAG: ATP-binding protein [Saccharospirillaceae bacterium]|nr:ATP-binding protein [Saccharospirillaceae bacterium]